MVELFLSYHNKDKKTAADVKQSLCALGMDVFLAHEDLEPSKEWQEEILKKLGDCDVFMPILTKNFHSSLWTDQETGIAHALKKHVFPLKVDADPYGFIGKVQALKLHTSLDYACSKIVRTLASHPALGHKTKDGVIKAFLESNTFKESERLAGILLELKPFPSSHLNRIVEGATENNQIYGGWRARDAVKELIRENRDQISRKLVTKFLKRVESLK